MKLSQTLEQICKDLVSIGGGHSRAIILKKFSIKYSPRVYLTLITENSRYTLRWVITKVYSSILYL
jgi:hypothetical protein